MKNIIIIGLLCFTSVVFSQTQEKRDTILCFKKNLIIDYPAINRINIVNYEEGFFKTINCVLDTAAITIHCGKMVNLPLTDLTYKTVCSEFILGDDIRSIRGYYVQNGNIKHFREDNYFKYNISIVYENVAESRLNYYEQIFNDIKIE